MFITELDTFVRKFHQLWNGSDCSSWFTVDDIEEASENKHEPKDNTKIVESEANIDSEKKQKADEAHEVKNGRSCTLEFYPEPLENIVDCRKKK